MYVQMSLLDLVIGLVCESNLTAEMGPGKKTWLLNWSFITFFFFLDRQFRHADWPNIPWLLVSSPVVQNRWSKLEWTLVSNCILVNTTDYIPFWPTLTMKLLCCCCFCHASYSPIIVFTWTSEHPRMNWVSHEYSKNKIIHMLRKKWLRSLQL